MTASMMLFVIACVVAVLGFALAGVIWTAHPVRGNSVECGTLREPVNPASLVRVASTVDPSVAIEAALAPQRCDEARAGVLFSQRMALAAGGVASATAAGAFMAMRREQQYAVADAPHRLRADSELNGYGLPGRPSPAVNLMDAHPRWATDLADTGNGDRPKVNPGRLDELRG